ncbi:30S ribosomal protein S15 [Candidatus Mycoplasma mahonii]|uniref:30S ribosomal protein S15 n=1 Tax=Candidatus Mycoplasma mahonii TaxID=3004105 RepID=UPI0026ED6689|nr:30S ribosomal protein S15 [Candidatus Mycoplasma mahonii]WKX02736.1 30S ribosomal protein S15 [Candidatus Mycoplasma mahonii]
MISKAEKIELVKKFGKNEKDSGDSAVQVAILTAEIESLKKHFEVNKKDKHSKRGFLAKIALRKKLLSYLKKQDYNRYQETIKALGLRK